MYGPLILNNCCVYLLPYPQQLHLNYLYLFLLLLPNFVVCISYEWPESLYLHYLNSCVMPFQWSPVRTPVLVTPLSYIIPTVFSYCFKCLSNCSTHMKTARSLRCKHKPFSEIPHFGYLRLECKAPVLKHYSLKIATGSALCAVDRSLSFVHIK